MKNIVVLVAGLLFAIAGCKTPVNVAEYRQSAETAAESGDYQIAVETYKTYFAQFPAENELEGSVYAQAAQAAFQASQLEQALTWFDQAQQKGYDEPSMYQTMAQIFEYQQNVSREITALETYISKAGTPDGDAYSRLFSIYYTTGQQEKAMDVWENVPDTEKRTEQNLERYFSMNKKMGNESTADSVSLALLEVAPEHIGALEWQAQKNYELGEARYQREMKAYEARPTTGNYQTLLRGLKAASAIFRVSLDYFEKLWEVNPDDRNEYAVYMNNIHVRFNDKEKADYYRKFIN